MADERNRILGQELTPGEEDMHADLVTAGKSRGLAAWEKFDVFSPNKDGEVQKQIVQTRWVLTWKVADGKKCVKAHLVAKGFQDPDLTGGLADTSGCVTLRSSHLQVVSLSAMRKWDLRSLDICKLMHLIGTFFACADGMGSYLPKAGVAAEGACLRFE